MAASKREDLHRLACEARLKSYSPYSQAKVGAAVRTADGRVFTGCNVENSSYGGTVCAERVAVFSAVAELGGRVAIAEVMVVTDATPAWPPCGLCRQVLAEFARPETPVHAANLKGETRTCAFGELQPQAFTPDHLLKK